MWRPALADKPDLIFIGGDLGDRGRPVFAEGADADESCGQLIINQLCVRSETLSQRQAAGSFRRGLTLLLRLPQRRALRLVTVGRVDV